MILGALIERLKRRSKGDLKSRLRLVNLVSDDAQPHCDLVSEQHTQTGRASI
jgi:hypothetical protein